MFTDPQIGQVGLSEAELTERGIDYIAADYPFDDHGKSILMKAKAGYASDHGVTRDRPSIGRGMRVKDAGAHFVTRSQLR